MALKKPLVVTNGVKQQIQTGDYVDPVVLGTGAATSSTVLRGNQTWTSIPNFYISDTAGIPSSPSPSDQWLNIDDGNIYTYFNDGDSSQWVEFRGSDITSGITNLSMPVINPTTPKDGDLRTGGGIVECYLSGGWKQIWPAVYS